jgi:folate-dependent phosphoribosylglycinamide formyltransferase PurN
VARTRSDWTLGFLASHRGTSRPRALDACTTGHLAARPAVVIANNGGARAETRVVPMRRC